MIPEPTPPLLQLTPRPDLGILVGRWGYQPDPAELPAAYQELMAVGVRDRCRFWLQDIRRRTHNDPATTHWLLTEYFPSMAQRLGGPLFVAYLVGPALHQSIVQTPGFVPRAAYADRSFAVDFFGDEGAAIHWLATEQERAG